MRKLRSTLKISLLLFIFSLTENAKSIDILSLYSGECQVDSGVVLGISNRKIRLLRWDGHVVSINRYGSITTSPNHSNK